MLLKCKPKYQNLETNAEDLAVFELLCNRLGIDLSSGKKANAQDQLKDTKSINDQLKPN